MSIISEFLNTTISVIRSAKAANSSGGISQTPTTVYSGIPAAVQPNVGTRTEYLDAKAIESSHRIYVDVGLTLLNGDRIVDATNNNYAFVFKSDEGGVGEAWCIWVDLLHG